MVWLNSVKLTDRAQVEKNTENGGFGEWDPCVVEQVEHRCTVAGICWTESQGGAIWGLGASMSSRGK